MEIDKEEKRKVKRKKEANEQFGRKMNRMWVEKRKLFLKEVSKMNGRKVEKCSRIKCGNGRLAVREEEVRRTWNDYFKDLYNTDTQSRAGYSPHVWLRLCSEM